MVTSTTDIFEVLGLSEDHFDQRGLPRYEDAVRLVAVQTDEDGRIHELIPEACDAWHAMREAAQVDGIELVIVSAFRSVARQAEIVMGKHDNGLGNDEIFAVSAPPGFSEHHTGRAIDIATPGYALLEQGFEESEAFAWLQKNATMFGFSMTYPPDNEFGFIYEPWHWAHTVT